MNTERPPKSYLGGLGATFATLGIVIVFGLLALPVLFMAGLGGASITTLVVMAGLVLLAAVALGAALYALSGVWR
jgi:hypothetical protein